MYIRKATVEDLPSIYEIFSKSLLLMEKNNNPQWSGGYPKRLDFQQDVEAGQAYVFCNDDHKVLGMTAVIVGDDPAYQKIDGEWLTKDTTYAAIHRLAVSTKTQGKGIGVKFLQAIEDLVRQDASVKSLRIDTHEKNIAMKKTIERSGYHYTGVVYMPHDGSPRVAYEKLLK